MKKSLLSILLAAFLAVISGCADDSKNGGGSSNPGGLPAQNIPVDETTVYEFTKEFRKIYSIDVRNPRTDVSEPIYPVLISQALGLEGGETDLTQYGVGIVKGVKYQTYFASQNNLANYNAADLTFCRYPKKLFLI